MITVITTIILVLLEDQMETRQDPAEATGMEAKYSRLRQYTPGKVCKEQSSVLCWDISSSQNMRWKGPESVGKNTISQIFTSFRFWTWRHLEMSGCLLVHSFFFIQINLCTQYVSTLPKLKPPLQRDVGKELGLCFTIKTPWYHTQK